MESKMKPIPLEALEHFLVWTPDKQTSGESMEPRPSKIVDLTDVYGGKSFIVTGAGNQLISKEREENLNKPPEK
jgi:hypothetical protein